MTSSAVGGGTKWPTFQSTRTFGPLAGMSSGLPVGSASWMSSSARWPSKSPLSPATSGPLSPEPGDGPPPAPAPGERQGAESAAWLLTEDPDAAVDAVGGSDRVVWTGCISPTPTPPLPTCWLWHPDVVEELWWLRCAHAEAYDPDTPANHPARGATGTTANDPTSSGVSRPQSAPASCPKHRPDRPASYPNRAGPASRRRRRHRRLGRRRPTRRRPRAERRCNWPRPRTSTASN